MSLTGCHLPKIRAQRAMITRIRKVLSGLSLPDDAVEYLCSIYEVTQFFDDVADNGDISRAALNKALWDCLVGLNINTFFARHSQTLLPVVSVQILKWQASDTVERQSRHDEKSFIWRAGYYDLVLLVFFLVHGREMAEQDAHVILGLYGEKYEDYNVEFNNA